MQVVSNTSKGAQRTPAIPAKTLAAVPSVICGRVQHIPELSTGVMDVDCVGADAHDRTVTSVHGGDAWCELSDVWVDVEVGFVPGGEGGDFGAREGGEGVQVEAVDG